MSFDRIRADWSGITVLEANELSTIDENLSHALDGQGGGAYSTSQALTVGGAGIQDANADHYAVPGPTASVTISNVTTHRLHVSNGAEISSTLTIVLQPDADGVSREISIDEMSAGALIVLRNPDNSQIAGWLIRDPHAYLRIHVERINSTWVMVSRSASPADPRSLSYASAPAVAPTINHVAGATNYWFTGNTTGNVLIRLPLAASLGSGTWRRIQFDRIVGGAVIQFQNGDAEVVHEYRVSGAGEINVTMEFVSISIASGPSGTALWRLASVARNSRPGGTRTLVLDTLTGTIDTNVVEMVKVIRNANRGGGADSGPIDFVFKAPLFEGQECHMTFNMLRGSDSLPQKIDFRAEDPSSTELAWISSDDRGFNDAWKYPVIQETWSWGGTVALLSFRVVDGLWRWMGRTH